MAHYVTESIWHFIGYMHIGELLNKTPLAYSGANACNLQTINHTRIAPARAEAEDLLSSARETPPFRPQVPAEPQLVFHARPLPGEAVNLKVPPIPPAADPPLDLATVLPALSGEATGAATATAVHQAMKVSATYTVGEAQYNDVHIAQVNSLLDADIMRGDPGVLLEAGLASAKLHALAEGSAELADLVQKAIDLLPANATPASSADGIDRMHATQDGDLKVKVPLDGDAVAEAVEPGRYVDGERAGDVAASGDVIKGQVAKIGAAVEAATPVERSPVETQTAPDGGALHIVTGSAPTGGAVHEAITGGNDLVNAAVLYDLADAAGSMIVRGDVHVTDAIVQVNVLQDNDAINAPHAGAAGFSGTALLAAAIAETGGANAGNEVTNEAAFVQEAGPVYGNVMLGGVPGSLAWKVDYVQGNLYDLTTVEQHNVVIDTDIGEQTTTGTHFIATLGENGVVNLVQLGEFGTAYDLIIVGGHYYEFNAVVQVNVLLDDDIVDQVAGGFAGDQSANADGNALSNDAAIVRIGGDSYKPLAGDPALLAETIGSMQTEFDYSLASGLPGNGTDTLKVLYITGDYYDYNVLLQTNVLNDSDQIAQAAPDGGTLGGSDAAAQTANAGGNALQNVALLVNVGSTSDYQYVGGEVYEDTLLVQANIVTDADDPAAADLHPDVVATIAALSGSADDTTSSTDTATDHPDTSASVDVMGGILT